MLEIDRLIDNKLIQLKKDLSEIAEKELKPFVKDTLQESIAKNVYGRPESDYYDRTGAFYDSVTGLKSEIGNVIEVMAVTDTEHTNPRHTSWISGETSYKGIVVDEHLDNWLEYGFQGLLPYPYEGSLSFTEAQYKVNSKATNIIKRGLKRKKYKVK